MTCYRPDVILHISPEMFLKTHIDKNKWVVSFSIPQNLHSKSISVLNLDNFIFRVWINLMQHLKWNFLNFIVSTINLPTIQCFLPVHFSIQWVPKWLSWGSTCRLQTLSNKFIGIFLSLACWFLQQKICYVFQQLEVKSSWASSKAAVLPLVVVVVVQHQTLQCDSLGGTANWSLFINLLCSIINNI